jgi:hypothetical protein
MATLQRVSYRDGQKITEPGEIPVRVLAVAEGYAMVRRKGCSPFVLEAKRVRKVSSSNKPDEERPAGRDS